MASIRVLLSCRFTCDAGPLTITTSAGPRPDHLEPDSRIAAAKPGHVRQHHSAGGTNRHNAGQPLWPIAYDRRLCEPAQT
jgi:hypothetical protein